MLTVFLIALAIMLFSGIVLIGGLVVKIAGILILIAIFKKIYELVIGKKDDGLS